MKDIYYSEGWNIYWERIAVSLSAQRTRVSNACNTEFRLLVILGDETIRLVRLCLQVKTVGFIIKGFALQHVFFLVLVNNFLSRMRQPFH